VSVKIAEIISGIGVDGARFIEEHVDPQFQALLYLYERMEHKDLFVPLVTANALVSYQLSGKGEEWWWEFARWFSEHPLDNVYGVYKVFLPGSKTNRRLTNVKLKRLERAEQFLQSMNVNKYYEDMIALQHDLAKVLSTQKNAKTVVFAVKMFGYAMRIATGEFRPYPMEVPIPVDSRFWQEVAERTRVPPLHIDSILWPAMSGDLEVEEKIRKTFGMVGEELIRLLSP